MTSLTIAPADLDDPCSHGCPKWHLYSRAVFTAREHGREHW